MGTALKFVPIERAERKFDPLSETIGVLYLSKFKNSNFSFINIFIFCAVFLVGNVLYKLTGNLIQKKWIYIKNY